MSDEDLLLAILNSTPVVDGERLDALADPAAARDWLIQAGGRGTRRERQHVLAARDALQAVIRGEAPPDTLAPLLTGVTLEPAMTPDGITWNADVPADRDLAVRAILTWDALAKQSPGRLRPCANDECRLYLLDRSRTNTARWCSMAICGNRMKARRHYQRARAATS
ncbi:CGNR zinc finger domain-containing protein [Asanoa sp. WMMD1127]|uniref:CGNR zinc finger domain-containing protein n=1 Tax=Asanoa sp. WMMD1127 TaxID=3016107 RepID=UPI00241638CD|nr:CGNR zinc finger domain-containing protein [Asanoa sp. WMMD1127]MDG4822970.1 CGNR zinc finger domain-containing protein [Asanoa sp. WMMD1127]